MISFHFFFFSYWPSGFGVLTLCNNKSSKWHNSAFSNSKTSNNYYYSILVTSQNNHQKKEGGGAREITHPLAMPPSSLSTPLLFIIKKILNSVKCQHHQTLSGQCDVPAVLLRYTIWCGPTSPACPRRWTRTRHMAAGLHCGFFSCAEPVT